MRATTPRCSSPSSCGSTRRASSTHARGISRAAHARQRFNTFKREHNLYIKLLLNSLSLITFLINKRILSILKFENVISVYSKNLNQKKKDRFLDFLAIESKLMSDKSYEIILHFAGNNLIKVNSEVIDCFLDDQGEPWETKNKPKHDIFDE